MRQNKIDNAITDCYRRLFEASTPQGDFDKLVEEAEIDERGQKVIPYMDYEIDEDVMDNIVEDIIGEYKIPKYLGVTNKKPHVVHSWDELLIYI